MAKKKRIGESGREITHRVVDGIVMQIVSPAKLRAILKKDGDSLTRPPEFGPDDEWDVGR